jgi:CRP/FNR family transcriptional regulator, cyclic AMP receptor protein
MGNTSGLTNQQFRALVTENSRLQYLTPNDWALIADKSQRFTFQKNEVLIQAGRKPRHVFVIVNGTARIESVPGLTIAKVTKGDICGEMSFLEDNVASASAIADSELEALAIEWTALQHLFELYPHLGSRFYRSLALNFSRRLRKQLTKE